MRPEIYTLDDLEEILPFGRSKLLRLCQIGVIPVTKAGRDYFIEAESLRRWLKESEGKVLDC